MPLDLTATAQDLKYLVRDRALQGTPLGDGLLTFAAALDGIHYEFNTAMLRLQDLEERVQKLENPTPPAA